MKHSTQRETVADTRFRCIVHNSTKKHCTQRKTVTYRCKVKIYYSQYTIKHYTQRETVIYKYKVLVYSTQLQHIMQHSEGNRYLNKERFICDVHSTLHNLSQLSFEHTISMLISPVQIGISSSGVHLEFSPQVKDEAPSRRSGDAHRTDATVPPL